MLVILGKTASGKDTIVKELCKKGYTHLITYTTRPRRKREPKNVYHFISDEEFEEKAKSGFFAEYRSYKTTEGNWLYGSAVEDYKKADDKTIVILDPIGYYVIQKRHDIPVESMKSIYLYASIPTIYKRLEKRGDKDDEIERRINSDNQSFKGLEMKVDRIVYNGENDLIDDVVQKIIDFDQGVQPK